MKNKLLAAMLLLGTASTAWSQSPPIPELLYYRFDGTGTTVPNLASNPPAGTATATIVGSMTQGSDGQCGGALIGTGTSSTNEYVNTQWAPNVVTSWTLSFWTNNVPSTTLTYYILGDVNAGAFRVFTGGVAGAGNWILRGNFTDVLANGGAAAGPTMTTFVYDVNTNEIRSYVNGVLNQIVAQGGGAAIMGSGPFKVGGYSSSANLPSGSLMDEFRFYDRALTVAEIQSLMITSTSSAFSVTSCGSYTVPSGDSTYTTSGSYMDTIPNMAGCDSVMTIDVTILSPTASTIAPVVCDEYDSPSGNYQWTASGTYYDTIPNAAGCDSVITINLTVNQPTFASVTEVSCDTSYTAPDGAVYDTSGTYMATIPNAAGCDSIITIDLTFNLPTSSSITETACNSYIAPDGVEYTTSGTYMATIPNAAGCDSVITIDLTVLQIDTAVTYTNGVLTAAQSTDVNYQWFNCATMSPISGENTQSFTPLVNGSYGVALITPNCTLNSNCHNVMDVGIDELDALDLSLFPNPVHAELHIVNAKGGDLTLQLFDNTGKLLQTILTSEMELTLDMQDKAPGVYLLRASSKGYIGRTFRIVHN